MLVHTVFFWLNEGLSDEDRSAFMKDLETLGDIPEVEAFHSGTPAATPDRPVIDASYDASICVILKDMVAHDAYQEHPIHKKFIEDNAPRWTKVQVYDAD